MEQLRKLAASLTVRQRISLAVAAALVAGTLYALVRWRRESDFRPLYTGLAAEDAGAVVTKLRESGVEYRISENGAAVLVPSGRIAEVRLQIAAAGLPKTGRAGFELFDKTNFGLTEFAEHINYQRAVEGELERSILSMAEVEQARVHLTFAKESIFAESRQPAKASVMVKLRPGRQLSGSQVLAMTQLVSSAVENLAPEAVSVLDMNGNLLSRRRTPAEEGPGPADAALEHQRQIEKDLLGKIGSTLEPLLGADKFRAGVSVECDFTAGEQSEETYDPSRAAIATSQKTEDVAGAAAATGGLPGTAANLPHPPPQAAADPANRGATRRTENVAYQNSRILRRVKLAQGSVKKISIGVLIDQDVWWEGTGQNARRVFQAPAAGQLKRIQDLVAAATGLNEQRGDRLVVDSLPFEATLRREPPAVQSAPPAPTGGSAVPLRTVAACGAVLLVLLAGVSALLLRRWRKGRPPVAARGELPAPGTQPAAERELAARLAEREQEQQRGEAEALTSLKLPAIQTRKAQVLAKHLVEAAKKDPAATARLLRGWIFDSER